MEDINFSTKNIVIFLYPRGVGGRFLMNCCGLSEHAVLQDKDLAESDLNGNLSSIDKFSILKQQLAKVKNKWTDLGCIQLFGIRNEVVRDYGSETVRNMEFNPVISKLSYGTRKFFIDTHSLIEHKEYCKLWINTKTIAFSNHVTLINFRSRKDPIFVLQEQWDTIQGSDWPLDPPKNLKQFFEMNKKVIEEIQTDYYSFYRNLEDEGRKKRNKNIEQEEYNNYINQVNDFVWNCDWYLDTKTTVNRCKEVYKVLNLPDFDLVKPMIGEYHKLCIKTLIRLR